MNIELPHSLPSNMYGGGLGVRPCMVGACEVCVWLTGFLSHTLSLPS